MRFQDWPARMDIWLRENEARPFSWAAWGCCLMTASHVDNITGSRHYADHAGKYTTKEEADIYLQSLGLAGLSGLATSILGAPLPGPRFAQRGDVVTFPTPEGPALGVTALCGMRIVSIGPGERGFLRLPLKLATAAWRV